jgi:hypothetical protein
MFCVAERERWLEQHERRQSLKAPEGVIRTFRLGNPWIVFALPLNLCEPQDRMRHAAPWVYRYKRDRLLGELTKQWMKEYGRLPATPLACPQLLCVRYSSMEPDPYADWAKQAIDCLQPSGLRRGRPFYGLGLIRNDSRKECDVHQWWEPAKVKEGFCVIEVRSAGSPTKASK